MFLCLLPVDGTHVVQYNRQREVEAAEKAKFKSERASLVNLYGTKVDLLLYSKPEKLWHAMSVFSSQEATCATVMSMQFALCQQHCTA